MFVDVYLFILKYSLDGDVAGENGQSLEVYVEARTVTTTRASTGL